MKMVEDDNEDDALLAAIKKRSLERCKKEAENFKSVVSSPEGWKAGWKNVTFHNAIINYSKIRAPTIEGNDDRLYDGWRWVEGKEIRVFTNGSIDEGVIGPVTKGIRGLLDDLNLDLNIKHYPTLSSHSSVTEPIRLSRVGESIDAEKVGHYFVTEPWRQPPYSQHADVLITDKPLFVGGAIFGQSEFSKGYIVLSLTNGTNNPNDSRNRQSPRMYDLVRRIAKHEAGHLLGYNLHHEVFDVTGYEEPDDCLMYWRCSTDRICGKCRDALLGFWEGLEGRTGIKFFR